MGYHVPMKKIQKALGVGSSVVALREGKGRGSPKDIQQHPDTFVVITTQGDVPCIEWVGARDAAPCPTGPRTTATTENDPRWRILSLVCSPRHIK